MVADLDRAVARRCGHLREHIPLAQAEEGKNIKHDISVPISRIGDFIARHRRPAAAGFPGRADGHLRPSWRRQPALQRRRRRKARRRDAFLAQQDAINRVVHDSVMRFGGSISAEHGLGALKRDEDPAYKSPVEID